MKKKRAQLVSKCIQPIRTNTYQTVYYQNTLLREEENFQRNERYKLPTHEDIKEKGITKCSRLTGVCRKPFLEPIIVTSILELEEKGNEEYKIVQKKILERLLTRIDDEGKFPEGPD